MAQVAGLRQGLWLVFDDDPSAYLGGLVMDGPDSPTVNDFLSRLYTLRERLASRAAKEAEALVTTNAAKGRLRSGATLVGLADVIEARFEEGVAETLDVLRHMRSVPGSDFPACRDQAFLRARELIATLRGATSLDRWLETIGRGGAAAAIEQRLAALGGSLEYRFRQFDVGLDQIGRRGSPLESGAVAAAEEPSPGSAHEPRESSTSVALEERRPKGFQVALSFAGEQRVYVRDVAQALAARHVAVFYDEFEANTLWGKDGAEYFHQVFAEDAAYVVMFISADYVAKAWTRQERRAALSRQIRSDGEYILPVRFDDSAVPGLPDTLQFLRADQFTPAELAVEIAKKVGVAPTAGKASDVPPPASGAPSGEVTFDYGSHDGRYVIGSGNACFETAWSKADDASIYLLNDPPSVHGIAIVRGAREIAEVVDASAHDFTSRHRHIREGEVAVLRNVNGFYAAVKVLAVEDDGRGADSDALTISYSILTDGSSDFSRDAATR